VLIAQRPEGKALAGLWEFRRHSNPASSRADLIRELHEEIDIGQ
jgi:hypothetical protein